MCMTIQRSAILCILTVARDDCRLLWLAWLACTATTPAWRSPSTSNTCSGSPAGSATSSPTPIPAHPCPPARPGPRATCCGTWPASSDSGPASSSSRPAGPAEDAEEAKRPETHQDLLADFDESSAALVAALEGAEPREECWTWSDDKTVAFVLRRQALEAVVHRFDAEQAAGLDLTEVDARLAADGIHEVLDVMYGGCPPWGDFSPLPHYVRVDATDTDSSVWVQLGRFSGTDPKDEVRYEEDDIHVVDDPGVEPDAVIEGTAEVLLARLWRRGDGADIHIAGDMLIVDHFRSAIHHPIE